MIITCEQCHSMFRLDDERVKETGSKVRCSKCKHVFSVFSTPAEQNEQEPIPPGPEAQPPADSLDDSEEQAISPDLGGGEEHFDFDFLEQEGGEDDAPSEESLEFDMEDLEFEPGEEEAIVSEETSVSDTETLDEASLELEMGDLEEAKNSTDGGTVSQEEDIPEESLELELGDIESAAEEEMPSEEAPSETVHLESESESVEEEITEEPPSLTLEKEDTDDAQEKPEEEGFDESDIDFADDGGTVTDTGEISPSSETEEKENTSLEGEDDLALENISDEDISTEGMESSEQWEEEEEELDPSEIKAMEEVSFDEDTEETEEEPLEEAPVPAQSRRKKRPNPLLLILLIVISVAGGIYAAVAFLEPLKSGIKIPYLNITIGGETPAPHDAGNLEIALLNIKGYFEENEETGSLFIIEGQVKNDYSKERSFVRIKGILYDKAGKIVKTKSVYCGNILTKTELENLSVTEINKKLLRQSGTNQSNVDIAPNAMIPFMVVFEDLPSDLAEYSVEVEQSV